MARNITFNGNSLQTSYIAVSDIDDANAPDHDVSLIKLAHANGSKIPYDQYNSRTITISGSLYGDNIQDLDARIDTFKGYFVGVNKNLDVDYNNTTRRYIATMQSINISRPGGLTYANFDVTFICTSPFGQDTTTTVLLNYTARQLFTGGVNGTFTSSTGISPYNSPSVVATTTSQHITGLSRALQITTTGTGVNAQQGAQQTAAITVVSGSTYTFSAYFKAAVGVSVTLRLTDTGGSTDSTATGTGDWFRMSVTRTAAATALTPYFLVNGANASVQVAYFDAAQVELGTSPTTFTDNHALVNYSQQADTLTVGGTAPIQYPLITINFVTITSGNYSFTVSNNNNGQQVTITRTWNTNDILVVDSYNRIITVNGTEVDFVGAFPEFNPGTNVLGSTCSFSGATLTFRVEYYQRYL